jgi:hypothetical protein
VKALTDDIEGDGAGIERRFHSHRGRI